MNGTLAASSSTSALLRHGPAFDLAAIRREFPLLARHVHEKPLVYLDNAATTQKPRAVLDAISSYYEQSCANVHRGVHALSDRATSLYEQARVEAAEFIGAASPREIVFVRGATEAINLAAHSFGTQHVGPGDEVIITWMEHHANIVPWQILCAQRGAALRVVPITDLGELQLDAYQRMLSPRTKLVALTHVSNALGTVNPVRQMIAMAHQQGASVLIDGAQAIAHVEVDVQDLDCDFYAFSGHKVYGPMGIGVLYGKLRHLESMPPCQFGGDMIETVTFEKTSYAPAPVKFEAGTPNVGGAIGLAAALQWLKNMDRPAIKRHEMQLVESCVRSLSAIPGVRIVGQPACRAGSVSFVLEDPPVSALDVGTRLDLEGIAVRTGHHCCQPLMQRLGVAGTVRASFAIYNSPEEVQLLAEHLGRIAENQGPKRHRAAVSRPRPEIQLPEERDASAATVEAAAQALLVEFEGLGDWAERYEYLIDLGKHLPPMPARLKTEANRVRGCQSTVYLAPWVRSGSDDVVEFLADSESEIVRGLVALLQSLYSGKLAAQILDFDLSGLLARLGLATNLTLSRRNGLAEMVKRLRSFAAGLTEPATNAPSVECKVAV
ncbi:MAG: SufS family cysteine desulfurase [Isosphaeraceae bacterium]